MQLRSVVCNHAGSLLLGIHMTVAVSVNRAHLSLGESDEIPHQHCTPAELNAKDIDLVVYGATGFTGRLAVEYLAASSPKGMRWAIAGRNPGKLEELREDLQANTTQKPSILVADLANADALLNMTRRTRAVISYAGPFEKYGGEALVRAALNGCAHYTDITSELPWKVIMVKRYAATAAARGLALVQSVGANSLPPDVLALATVEAAAADGSGPPDEVKILFTENNGWFSGGTVASGIHSMRNHMPGKDPYALAPESPPQARVDTTFNGIKAYGLDEDFNTIIEPYPVVGESDCMLIRRSLFLRFPGARVSVSEGQSNELWAKHSAFLADPRMMTDPPPWAPIPGEGPPRWLMEKGSFVIKALARRKSDGHEVRMTLHGKGDIAFSGSAKMSAEFAVGLALNGPAGGKGGYLTPATALSPGALQHRLERAAGGKFMTFVSAGAAMFLSARGVVSPAN